MTTAEEDAGVFVGKMGEKIVTVLATVGMKILFNLHSIKITVVDGIQDSDFTVQVFGAEGRAAVTAHMPKPVGIETIFPGQVLLNNPHRLLVI